MPAERIVMRHVREVLRLKFVGSVPTREIARRIGVAASTVRATLERFRASGLSWPLPDEMTDTVLEWPIGEAKGVRWLIRYAGELVNKVIQHQSVGGCKPAIILGAPRRRSALRAMPSGPPPRSERG